MLTSPTVRGGPADNSRNCTRTFYGAWPLRRSPPDSALPQAQLAMEALLAEEEAEGAARAREAAAVLARGGGKKVGTPPRDERSAGAVACPPLWSTADWI